MLTARKNFFSALSRSDPPVKEERKGPQVDPRVTVFVGMYPECSVVEYGVFSMITSMEYTEYTLIYIYIVYIYIYSYIYLSRYKCSRIYGVHTLYRCSRPASLQPISGGREKR